MENTQKVLPYAEVLHTREWNWPAILFVSITPVLAIAAVWALLAHRPFEWVDLIPFTVMYLLCGLSITVGYHRLFSHRTFETSPIVQFFLLVFGAASVQNTLLDWASNHRFHHQYSDREGDPYSINRGFFWAHMGWMFLKFAEEGRRTYRNSDDLKRNPLVIWQAKYYWLLAFGVGWGLPTLIGAAFGRPLEGLVWGGLVRMVVAHQATFCINSMAHTFGTPTHERGGTARDSHLLALVSFGEGYHSFHHAYGGDYRIGAQPWELDLGKWVIRGLAAVGLARSLRTAGPPVPRNKPRWAPVAARAEGTALE